MVDDSYGDAYLQRLKGGPTDVLPGTLIEATEKNTDIPVGTRGYIVEGPLAEYEWPVYEIHWIDAENTGFADGNHCAAAFFKVIQEPVKFESVTDVEKFLEVSDEPHEPHSR